MGEIRLSKSGKAEAARKLPTVEAFAREYIERHG